MDLPLLTRRERLIWIVGFVLVSALLVSTRFTSADGDSMRYATLSARLSELPVSRWVAPEWWGLGPDTELSGYFQEHPAGLFLIPAMLGRLGVPAEQAPYIFGVGAGLAALVLLAQLVARLTTREDGRAVLVLLQLMPVAFVFRIRDNHEYPMLVCLLLAIIGLDALPRSFNAVWLVVAAFAAGLLIKGIFVAPVIAGAMLWILINPTQASRARSIWACLVALVCMTAVAFAYDAWYLRVTGQRFWTAYWQRQLGPLELASPLTRALDFAQHLGFYIARLLFHPAPWSWFLVWSAIRVRPASEHPTRERRAFHFALVFTAASILALSLAGRLAERYAFSTTYLIGAAGAVVAYRTSSTLRRWLARAEHAVPALPALTWIVLVVLRLVAGRFLPRI
jgi:4-amino-4-deoxy-L-arabinose transferase-like glycosyltransferase